MARDPYKYFRVEAHELLDGLQRGALDLEKGAGAPERVVHMLRLAHTLKGAARVVRQGKLAELAHAVEDTLEPHRDRARGAPAHEATDRLLGLLDQLAAGLASLEPEPAAAPAGAPPPAPEPLRNMRVAIEEMDALLEGVFETGVQLTAIRRQLEEFARARRLASALVDLGPSGTRARAVAEELAATVARLERSLGASLDRVDREVAQVRDKANELRLVPASAIFGALERAARDAAQASGKSVRFETSGGEQRLEANVLFALRDALLHVVRNAVAHGVEPESERRALGKPPAGRVSLDVRRRGAKVVFACSDDGCGFDVEAVRRAAVSRGVATAEQVAGLNAEQVLRLALESGVSTARKIDEVSGRGVGLDVVRATVARLKGDVTLGSRSGAGTTVQVVVPLSVSSIEVLSVDAGGMTLSLPLDAVRRTVSLAAGDVSRSGHRESIVAEGAVVPFVTLAALVGLGPSRLADRAARSTARAWTAVVIHAGEEQAAIGVDRLLGTSGVVVRPLPRLAGPLALATGACLDAEGNPQLVLDPRGLVEAAQGARLTARQTAEERHRAPILVVDDSLTTRMLEQSILESAGYAVETATSAEEGLLKARSGTYSLFLVDVEMPGMDGFGFVSETQADPALRSIPAILVTSRDAAQDRRRGEEVGARAYVVKGEFDQGHLLRVIGQLIG